MKAPGLKSLYIILAFLLFSHTPTMAAWFPIQVDIWDPPFNKDRTRYQTKYSPLEKAAKKWRICVSIPHLKDPYFIAVNFGLIDEAKRLGVRLNLYEAGGYNNLDVQRRQISECMEGGSDGLIVSAISESGLNDLVKKFEQRGQPVVDMINGMSSPDISAKAAVDFWDTGYQAGMYLNKLLTNQKKSITVAWFPGPKGAAWVNAGNDGFNKATVNDKITVVATRYGDTGRSAQGKLIIEVLDKYPKLDVIVGTSVTAEAAVEILRRRGLVNKIKVLSYYYSPGVHKGIRRGSITAAPSDLQAIQARIAVDTMVRILEKKKYFKHVAPQVMVVDRKNIRTFDSSTSLPPRGFRPIFSINE